MRVSFAKFKIESG